MSVLPCATNQNLTQAYFLLANVSSLNVNFLSTGTTTASTINVNFLSTGTTTAGFMSTTFLQAKDAAISSISTTNITLDGNTIDTAGSGFGSVLLLNGVPIATLNDISSITDWSYYPAVSTVNMNSNDITNLNNLFGSNATLTNNITATTGNIRVLTSSNIVNSNDIMTNTLTTTGLLQAGSVSTPTLTTGFGNISSISSASVTGRVGTFPTLTTGFGNISSISSVSVTGLLGNFSTLTAESVNSSTLTTGFGNISSISSVSVTGLIGTFSSLTGSVIFPSTTSGLSTLIVSTLSSINTTSVRGTFENLSSQNVLITSGLTVSATPTFNAGGNFNGARPNFNTGINTSGSNNFNNTTLDNVGRITANTVFIGSPNYVELQTSSFTTLLNNRGADVGGQSVINLQSRFGQATRINITADASSALSPTPTQIITLTANGATSLTQNAVGGRVSIVANAGSGSGCNILGFGEIDLTAYSSAPFAGVIKESAGSILAYSGLTVPAVGIFGNSYYSALGCLSLTAGATPATTSFPGVVYLRGDNGTKVDNGFTSDTITATGNSTLPTITTNGLTAFTGSSLAFFATSQNIQFNSATVGFNANIAGAFSVSTITNVSTINGSPYVPGGGGGASTISTFTSLTTSSFTVSSINNAAYPPASVSSWVSTATTPLIMDDYYIDLRPTGFASTTGLSYGSIAPFSVGIDGPYLFGFTQGALGTTSNANDISLAWDTAEINIYKTVDFEDNKILNLSSITASGELSISAGTDIKTSAVSTINTVSETVFTGGVSRELISDIIPQPVIQYGQVSSSGSSGAVTVTMPTRYTSVSSYLPFAVMADAPAAEIYVSTLTRATFEIGWQNGGGGAQLFNWHTMGT